MRAAILELLKSQEQISGELISSKLHISRAAVAKHIKILRQAGYQIEASPKTGYRLIGSADILSEAELTPLLNPRDLWKIHCFAELPSTNTHLRKLAEQNAADHTIIIAEQQTAGQGRLNRSWYSENRKSLLTSLLLRPPIPPTAARTITLTTAIAICTALRKLGIDAWIKWPNDILSGSGKKLCGIKSEMRCDMDNTEWLIVGIGLNINNQDFPDELPHASSLFLEQHQLFNRAKVAADCYNSFQHYYQILLEQGFEALRCQWLALAVSIGQEVTISSLDSLVCGIATDIDQEGSLLLKTEGQIRRINCGDMLI